MEKHVSTKLGLLFILAIVFLTAAVLFFSQRTQNFQSSLTRAQVASISTLEGQLGWTHIETFKAKTSQVKYFLTTDDGHIYSIEFNGDSLHAYANSRVKVKGNLDGNTITIQTLNAETFQVLSTPPPPSTSPEVVVKKIAIIMYNFQDNPSQFYTESQVRGMTFTNNDSVNAYYREVSNNNWIVQGNTRVDGDVYGWFTLPYNQNQTDCQANWYALEADTLAGINARSYDAVIYIFPGPVCGATMLGARPPRIFVGGEGFYGTYVATHELGHVFLDSGEHAGIINCTNTLGQRVPLSNTCTYDAYADPFDIMSASYLMRHTNTVFKRKFGFHMSTNTQTVTANGTYTVDQMESGTNGIKTLRVLHSNDFRGNLYLYLEYRRPFGFDNFNSTDPVVNGVSMRISHDYAEVDASYLIDSTAATGTYMDSALLVGNTFYDPISGTQIETLSTNSTSATVRITLNHFPTNTPTPTPTPLSQLTPTPTIDFRRSDLNRDTVVTAVDFNLFKAQYGVCTGYCTADINCNGTVSTVDQNIFRQYFGQEFSSIAPVICPNLTLTPTP